MAPISEVVPYTCVHIDADFKAIAAAAKCCISRDSAEDRTWALNRLISMFTTNNNANSVMPCLCVRTGFDLFCQAMGFPPGSEIIMSAINIPDMVTVAKYHQLNVVPWDVNIDTLAPKIKLLPELITEHTVAVLVAHIYGTTFDMSAILEICKRYGLVVIEDCAQAFGGFAYLGNPESDISLFSFGVIKYQTAFGGAIAKIKDKNVHQRMVQIQESYALQRNMDYLKKLVKYTGIYLLINVPAVIKPGMILGKIFSWNYQTSVVNWLRGFPQGLIRRIRYKPCTAVLVTMADRLSTVSEDQFKLARTKAKFVAGKISSCVRLVGTKARSSNNWLFPVLVDDATKFSTILNSLGIDSYRGATQLDVILPSTFAGSDSCSYTPQDQILNQKVVEPSLAMVGYPLHQTLEFGCAQSEKEQQTVTSYHNRTKGNTIRLTNGNHAITLNCPKDAQYLIDHVVYLPVHKDVPLHYLNCICEAVKLAALKCDTSGTVNLNSKL